MQDKVKQMQTKENYLEFFKEILKEHEDNSKHISKSIKLLLKNLSEEDREALQNKVLNDTLNFGIGGFKEAINTGEGLYVPALDLL